MYELLVNISNTVTGHYVLSYSFLGLPYHTCNVCFRRYRWKRGLTQHQRYSCGKDPQFPCPFPGCPYKARIKGNVKQHFTTVHVIGPKLKTNL